MTTPTGHPFQIERLGIVLRPDQENPNEQWGVLNPGGVRGADGAYYLFPRLVAAGNYSRIGRVRVIHDRLGNPAGGERLGYALEPQEPYEVARTGGGVEDPRVTYVEPLRLYVMAYTAFTPPYHPRIALAISQDLVTWTRLGPLRYATEHCLYDLNRCGSKDGVVFPDVVRDPQGRPSLAILHRPTYAVTYYCDCYDLVLPPGGRDHPENIWISYVPLERVQADVRELACVDLHRVLLAPQAAWESIKIGAGAPPVRLPYGWLLLYHGVSRLPGAEPEAVRYCAGAAVLDLESATTVLYRSSRPILEPDAPYEVAGLVPRVVFPTATDRRADGRLDLYYGGGDSVTAAGRLTIPAHLSATAH